MYNDAGVVHSTGDGVATTLAWLKTSGSGGTPILKFSGPKGSVSMGQQLLFTAASTNYGGMIFSESNNSSYYGLVGASTGGSDGVVGGSSTGATGNGAGGSFWKSYNSSTTPGGNNYDGSFRSYGVVASSSAGLNVGINWKQSGTPAKSVAYLALDDGTNNVAGLFQNFNTSGNVTNGVQANAFLALTYANNTTVHSGEFQYLGGTGNIVSYTYAAGKDGGSSYGLFAAVSNSTAGYVAYNGYSFYAQTYTAGGGNTLGSYSIGGYGPFTGSHDAFVAPNTALEAGDIVVDLQVLAKKSVSDAVTMVGLSTAPNQKSVVGVAASSQAKDHIPSAMSLYVESTSTTTAGTFILDPQYQSVVDNNDMIIINSVGEGLINVCGEGGNIEIGDLITSSSTPGKGMRQADDLVHNYTVAKAREAYAFTGTEIVQIACTYHCG